MGRVNSTIKAKECIRDSLKMIYSMEKENLSGIMDNVILDNGKMG